MMNPKQNPHFIALNTGLFFVDYSVVFEVTHVAICSILSAVRELRG